ncbi:hypothetical protein [Deinococcus daejeonensis]|uniref:Lipoprotein n=1 Tax=Deinococcus daejeonensis TaxID=1007098 RepID=A0ABQ2IXR7_9DEIO|nr:hypothetical protein [Deinococcus daejeonensis]GGN31312.1 hypothetical protein GCM10010842_07150 [Deinococcus daejeonensis]
MRTIALTAALITTLTACTAIQRGEQENYPVELASPYASASVAPGKTQFVQVTYPRSIFEDDNELDRYFDQLSVDVSSVRASGDKIPDPYMGASWIKLTSVDAPKGISVVLVKSEIGALIANSRLAGNNVQWQQFDKVRLTYKVSVAADFTPTPKKVTSSSSTLSKYLPNLSDVLPLDSETAQLKFSVNGAVQSAALAVRTTPEERSK